MPGPATIYSDNPGALPASYPAPPGLAVDIESVSAMFDGSGASAAFIPCLSLYSQDGKLLGRYLPIGITLGVGDKAEVTFASGVGGSSSSTSAVSTPSKLISLATTNSTLVRAGLVRLAGYYIANLTTTTRYVKLYDKATAPIVGTDVPKWTLPVPAGAAANIQFFTPLSFSLGFGFGMTTGVADNDTGAVGAAELVVNWGII